MYLCIDVFMYLSIDLIAGIFPSISECRKQPFLVEGGVCAEVGLWESQGFRGHKHLSCDLTLRGAGEGEWRRCWKPVEGLSEAILWDLDFFPEVYRGLKF